jgi:hypothetical protein
VAALSSANCPKRRDGRPPALETTTPNGAEAFITSHERHAQRSAMHSMQSLARKHERAVAQRRQGDSL